MTGSVIDNKRIAKNTLMLYIRQVLILLINLVTVRFILDVLGVVDYGIYTAVAGVVTFFTFLRGTMSSATQRFFSFSLGLNDSDKLKKTFTSNLLIYFAIAVTAFLLMETIGLWFVQGHLKIPAERYDAAIWIYHFAVGTFISSVFMAPFTGIIVAHEDMQIYAYVSVVEVVMQLGILFLIMHLPGDNLIAYGFFLFLVSVIIASIYIIISLKKYDECQFRKFYWDKSLLKEISTFTGWTLFGQITTMFRNQAVTILLNQVFNPIVVAARAIAVSISGRINVFSMNFSIGLYPSIIKSYAAGDRKQMFSLIFNGSKITFFLMWVFALPMLLEMEFLLKIWLNNVPQEAVLFTRLGIVEILINSISLPLTTAARAPGKVKVYELVLGAIQLLIFITAWLILKLGYEAYSVFVVAILANVIMFFARLIIVKHLIGLSINLFVNQVVMPSVVISAVSLLPSFAILYLLPEGIWYSIFVIIMSMLLASIAMYFIGLNKDWRMKVRIVFQKKIYTLLHKKRREE